MVAFFCRRTGSAFLFSFLSPAIFQVFSCVFPPSFCPLFRCSPSATPFRHVRLRWSIQTRSRSPGLSQEKAIKDIKRALIGRGWTITAERPGEIDLTLTLRTHTARIRVTWDAQAVRIACVSSIDLDYKERKGERFIHSNYLSWISNIVKDMGINMQLSAIE